jgi:catechol 2,3-dioxygenase
MTAIRGFTGTARRPGEFGVHSLDHFGLAVPDAANAAIFYASFGLEVRMEHAELGLYTAGNPHRWGVISEGPSKRLQYKSFGAYEEDFAIIGDRLEKLGIQRLDPPANINSASLWFRDHDGELVEIFVAEKMSPNQKSHFGCPSARAGTRGACGRSAALKVQPRRLAHLLVFTRDVNRAIEFYRSVLGLRLSDRSGDLIAFLHGIHGSDHHLIAFAKSHAPGLHHCSWDVGSIEEVGLGAMQMADKGFSAGWGLGRHVLGSNYFHYVRDPWGSYSEYSSDIDYIPFDCDWLSGDHPPEDSIFLWGPEMPKDFVVNHETSP